MSEESRALRDAGMAQALEARAVQIWRARAYDAIDYLAWTGSEFTSEDVVRLIGLPHPGAEGSNRNNAVGAVMNAAARRGVITRVGWSTAQRKTSHAAALAVWVGVVTS